jgi:hypothetical protein
MSGGRLVSGVFCLDPAGSDSDEEVSVDEEARREEERDAQRICEVRVSGAGAPCT